MDDPESYTMDLPDSADEPALRRVKTVARLMDDAVRVPGTDYRVGLDPILGVLPVAGDAVSAAISLYIVAEAAYLGVPLNRIVKMLANVAVDATVGSIPVLGTIFDAVWKANEWNVNHIEEFLAEQDVDGFDDDGDTGPINIDITEE